MKILPILLLAAASGAHAEFLSGNDLLGLLTGNAVDRTLGRGYVAGVYDVTTTVAHCAPGDVTLKQVSDVVQQGLEVIPAHRHKTADMLVLQILKTVWPCAKKPTAAERSL